jgi:hypothetical protein
LSIARGRRGEGRRRTFSHRWEKEEEIGGRMVLEWTDEMVEYLEEHSERSLSELADALSVMSKKDGGKYVTEKAVRNKFWLLGRRPQPQPRFYKAYHRKDKP